MINKLFGTLLFLVTSAAIANPTYYMQAEPQIDLPPIKTLKQNTKVCLAYGNDPTLEKAFNEFTRNGRAPNIITEGFIKFAYNSGAQPIVKTIPFQETVISLEPGEKFTNISSGDPNRWSYAVAVSGFGELAQQHVLVKPSMSQISTNMVITTDRRIYNLKLISADDITTKAVSFWYPEEMLHATNSQIIKESEVRVASVPDVALDHLNFNYSMSCGFLCHRPIWAPVRIFDDGTHTFIQFSPIVANRDMPALFIADNGEKELVNYRYKSPYFVVDKIFKQGVLIMGIGHAQKSLKITNQSYV